MKTFKDLTFKLVEQASFLPPMYRAYLEFDNGRAISVVTEPSFIQELDEEDLTFPYADPWHGEYEVGFLQEDGDLGHVYIQGEIELLENIPGNSVARHCRVRDISDIMKAIQKL